VGQILPQPATEQSEDLGPTVRPISRIGPAVAPLVFDDLAAEPVRDPVIGPELAAARNRVGLSVDELADRTRIRPHVIESIEVDDFAPCGGDFYARGHLRTLARVLGTDPAPLLGAFEERYSSAPVNARRVFEAELATGMTGSMRGTRQGPRWGLLAAVVLCLLLVWGVVRFFAAESPSSVPVPSPALAGAPALEAAGDPVAEEPAPVDRDERGAGGPQPDSAVVEPLTVTVMAAHATTTVVVRDRDGRSVFEGELLLGQKRRVTAAPPVSVSAVDAGAVEIEVAGRDRGVLGELGVPGRRTFE
jgi:cytoskeletal protein RodZ